MSVRFAILFALAASIGGFTPSSVGECRIGGWGSACSTTNSGTQLDLTASSTTPGRPATDAAHSPVAGTPPPAPTASSIPCLNELCRPTYSVATIPEVKISDLASFRPAAPTLSNEPSGFAVAGLPTNLVATASEHHMSGELLGWDVTVRFVPAGFVFEYGDGSSSRTTAGGASWGARGLPQFTPTETSHIYRQRGEYVVGVSVQYSASVDFGGGTWRAVPGYITASTGGHGIRVVEATTALVDRTCAANPTGPAC